MTRSCLLLALALLALPANAAEPVTVVALGDSITKGVRPGVKADETFAALLGKRLKEKGLTTQVVNVGIGGERTDGALARLDRDVLSQKPRAVLIMYGTNDSYVDRGKTASRLSVSDYRANLVKLVESLRAKGAEPILMTEPRWAPEAKNGHGENPNERLERYLNACRDVAKEKKVRLVDHYTHWAEAEKNGTKIRDWTTDGCHPNPRGHIDLADRIWPVLLETLDSPAGAAAKLTSETFEYASSVDGVKPLKADVAFRPDGKPKPLLVVMHGYSGSRKAVTLDLQELAERGVFAVAPDMRGCGDSAGKWDSGGLDVHDIVDAVLAAVAKYPKEIDPRNLNIVGYSGGGGNAIACMVRFPDLFRTSVSFFGISDYGGWHASKGRPDCNARMERVLGGPPEKLPAVYLARNATPAAANPAPDARLHFFWDEAETQCPADMVEKFIATYRKAGGKHATTHVSKKSDDFRWVHNYRSGNRALSKADDLFLPDVLSEKPTSPRLSKAGKLIVPGYIVTRRFQVWVEDGQKGQVTVEYDLRGPKPVVTVLDNPGRYKVQVKLTSPLANLPE